MLKTEYESLSQRFDRFEKVNFPLQSSIINCATQCLNALNVYLVSDKGPEASASLKECLDKWRFALDEYEKVRKADKE